MDEEQQPEILEEQPQGQQPSRIYDSLVQEEKVSSFLSQTSPLRSMANIDYILRGYMYNQEERKYVKVSDGIPNKIRLDFLQMLTPHLSEDARMTNLSDHQINQMMAFIIEWVVDYLDCAAKEHNLIETQMTKIGLILLTAVYYTILRAQNGMESKEVFDSLKLGENINSIPQNKVEKDWYKFWK